MGSFIGTYNHVIDSKNRMTIPSKIKSTFLDEKVFYLSLGIDGNIDLRLEKDHLQYLNKITPQNIGSLNQRKIMRRILANTYMVEMDSSSRILIPQNLINSTKIIKEIYIIGMNDHYEIWAKEEYDKMINEDDLSISQLIEEVLGNGI